MQSRALANTRPLRIMGGTRINTRGGNGGQRAKSSQSGGESETSQSGKYAFRGVGRRRESDEIKKKKSR